MTLTLAIEFTADASELVAASQAAKAEVVAIGGAAANANTPLQGFGAALDGSATNATASSAASAEAARQIALLDAATTAAANNARSLSTGLDQTGAAAERTAASASRAATALSGIINQRIGVATDFDGARRAADVDAYGRSLDELRARFNPLFAAGREYRRQLDQIRAAEKVGAISAAERADAVDRLKAAFAGRASTLSGATIRQAAAAAREQDLVETVAAEAAREAARQRVDFSALGAGRSGADASRDYRRLASETPDFSGLAARSAAGLRGASGLGSTARDVETLGRNMKLSAQEAANLSFQLNDVFVSLASGQNPLTVAIQQGSQIAPIFGGIRGTFAALASVVTPATAAIGAVSAAAIVGTVAWTRYDASTREVATALAGLGQASGATAGALEADAGRLGDAYGLSTVSVRALQATLLRTGRIGADQFDEIIGLSKDFAATIGGDVVSAGEELADIFRDPVRGAQQLQSQYGLVTGATVRYVRQLAEQNRMEEARQVLIEALPDRLADASLAANGFSRAWASLGTAASDALDDIGAALERHFFGPTIEQRLAELRAAREVAAQYGGAIDEGAFAREERLLVRMIERQKEAAEARKRAGEIDALSSAAVDTASRSPVNQDGRRALGAERDRLRAGLADPNLTAREVLDISRAIDATTRAIESYLPPAEQRRRLDALDLQIAQARDPVTRAALEAERERVQLLGQVITTTTAAEQAEAARARVIGEAVSAAQISAADMAEETAVRRQVNDAVEAGTISLADADRVLREELALRPLIAGALRAEGAERAALTEAVEKLRAANAAAAAEEARTAAAGVLRGQQDRLDDIRQEIDLIGQSADARERALAVTRADRILRDLPGGGGAMAGQIRANELAQASYNLELDRTVAAWKMIERSGEDAIDGLVEALQTGDFEGAFDSILKDLNKQLLQLGVANPLKNSLLGQNLPTLADAGGVVSRLLGGSGATTAAAAVAPSAYGSVTMTAGTVYLSGLGGLPGLGGPSTSAATSLIGTGAPAAIERRTLAPIDPIRARVDGAFGAFDAAPAGQALKAAEKLAGVDTRLQAILAEAAKRFDAPVQVTSGFRSGDPRFHGKGLASDVAILGPDGRKLPNYQDASAFRDYERFAQTARQVQIEKFPELTDDFRWGGYFSGGRGKYGAMDPMHFDLGGSRVGMAGGSWEGGLTAAQRRLWPGAQSAGLGADQALGALPRQVADAGAALEAMGQQTTASTDALALLGDGVQSTARAVGGATGGAEKASAALATSAETMSTSGNAAVQSIIGVLAGGAESLQSGLGGLVSVLLQAVTSAGGGGLGGIGSGITNFLGALVGVDPFGYAAGGYTGDGPKTAVAGPVHRGEFVFDAETTRKHRPLFEAIHSGRASGYQAGGFVSGPSAAPRVSMPRLSQGGQPTAGPTAAPQVIVNNYSRAEVRQEEEEDERGGRRQVLVIEDMIGAAISRPGSKAGKAFQSTFGGSRAVNKR